MRYLALPAALLLILAAAGLALAGAGLPALGTLTAGPYRATIWNDSSQAHTGTNTFTVQVPNLPEGNIVTLRLTGPQGQAVEVPLQNLQVLAGPAGAHGEDGHGEDGHADDGHGDDRHADDGHAEDGHAEDGQGEAGHGKDGHAEDGQGEDGHGGDGHVDGDGHGGGDHGLDVHADGAGTAAPECADTGAVTAPDSGAAPIVPAEAATDTAPDAAPPAAETEHTHKDGKSHAHEPVPADGQPAGSTGAGAPAADGESRAAVGEPAAPPAPAAETAPPAVPVVPAATQAPDCTGQGDDHGPTREFNARGQAALDATGDWTATLVIGDDHGSQWQAATTFAVVRGGPNRQYLGFVGLLMGGSVTYGAIQRRRLQPNRR